MINMEAAVCVPHGTSVVMVLYVKTTAWLEIMHPGPGRLALATTSKK